MNLTTKTSVPRYQRDNITSHLLVSQITGASQNLTVTLVEMEGGGVQRLHAHEPEQVYFPLEGQGRMTVDAETRMVQTGDCVFIPSFAQHGLENIGQGVLRYLSAASPSFTREECEHIWPLKGLEET